VARRIAIEEDPSALAIWARRFAFFAIAVAMLSVLLVRGGFVEAIAGVAVLGAALLLAAIGIVLALASFIVIWIYGNPGFAKALTAMFIGAVLTAYPAFVAARGFALPRLADITTDMTDPPRFEAIARLRSREANPVAYPGPEAALKQREAYPNVTPLDLGVDPDEAYRAALDVITKKKWRIVDLRPPQGGRRDGRIEAVALTTIMGFRDDIVVRVRGRGESARVDIRSASRYGKHDLGSNARRIRNLLEEIEEEAGTQPAAKR
jgi:uncharacterized protein (DUF1499 family)